ncbi:3-hydroxyisobutyrate dehydrogenase [Janthinobacterium fluminis]|uniref:3-hydroxyisobutyrate dehydrogenase n=1 Tax=Janthinobacterium fluminis TaxID=2987524 RepID=A0ABT5K1G0_9BURK|nr:3-hydroxyisobutyrate dehydrogenase [Janthinobacterium fluminis]MDC8758275.1 3-hydroxyisobutyrate dehydrogenase [Janthinobacterium fluminis]
MRAGAAAADVVFIGLGNMGMPMALNLVRSGATVAGFDLQSDSVARFVAAGGSTADGRGGAVAAARVVFTMLPAGEHVLAAYLGEDGILAHARPDVLLVDCSTIAPAAARTVAQAAAQRGLAMLDAPVSGGTAGAAAAALTFMVGGDADALARARPYLEAMGKAVFHAGGPGSGQAVKICNNMLLGILMIGTSEALRLGIANGLDPKVVSAIMAHSSGRNWALEAYNPCPGVAENVPAARGYTGGFGVDLMLKDLGLALDSAAAGDVSVPLGTLAHGLYARHSGAGAGGLDFSSIFAPRGAPG